MHDYCHICQTYESWESGLRIIVISNSASHVSLQSSLVSSGLQPNFVKACNSFYRAFDLTSNAKFQRYLLKGTECEDIQAEYKDECTKNVICIIVLRTSPTDDTSLYKQTPCYRLVPQGQQYLSLPAHPTDRPSGGHLPPELKYPHSQSITDAQNCKRSSLLAMDYLCFWQQQQKKEGKKGRKKEERIRSLLATAS